MYTRTIEYEDYDGNKRSIEAHFHLNKAELMEMQASWDGGLDKILKKIVDEKDQKRMIEMFKMIILKSYGEKSLDGNRFMKSPEITEAFTQTEAYSEFFMLLATDDKVAAEFVNGIMPKGMVDEAKKELEKQNQPQIAAVPDNTNK